MKNLKANKDTYAIFKASNDVFRYLAKETSLWLGSFDQRKLYQTWSNDRFQNLIKNSRVNKIREID